MDNDWSSILPGTPVFSSDNENVGNVEEVGAAYLLSRKGLFFVKDRYIPFSAVQRVESDAVYLNVAKDQLDAMDWDAPPTESAATLSGSDRVDADLTRSAGTVGTTVTEVDASADMVVPVVEEELRIGKREVDSGGVRVSTHIEEVPVNEQVTLRDETVEVERHPVDRTVTNADLDAFKEGTFEVRETDQEAVVDKQARVVEEVVVRKDTQERTETVQDTVRRTDVEVEQLGGETSRTNVTTASTTTNLDTASTTDEGAIERGASKLGNAVEGATGADLDRDGDVGRRDPRNNI